MNKISLAALDPTEPFDPIIERLSRLHPKVIDLTLDRLMRLLDILGNPQERLPPVIHVAGTNGKGSTVAFCRGMLEATGHTVHALTSPHLIHFCERIRVAGELIEEKALVALLEECEAANGEAPITFFEMAMAAATLAFSRTPADFLLLEVGLGGRFDATNIVAKPAASIITPISIDHQEYLGQTIPEIAGEKAGIIKPGCPVIAAPQTPEALAVIQAQAAEVGADLYLGGQAWEVRPEAGGDFRYMSQSVNWLLPSPPLRGAHQCWNAGAALAALEAIGIPGLGCEAAARGMSMADWPARMQLCSNDGGLARLASYCGPIWIDGAHNTGAAAALAAELALWPRRPILVTGMLLSKDYRAMLAILKPHIESLIVVPVPRSSAGLPVQELAEAASQAGIEATSADTLSDALAVFSERSNGQPVLIAGSLYLAGEALRLDQNG